MISFGSVKSIYLANDFVDFRKSIDGLVNIIHYTYQCDPYSSSLFIFCNKARNKLKIIHYDHNGFWLYYKRLDKSTFKWPKLSSLKEINDKELSLLLVGIKPCEKIGFDKTNYKM